MADWHSRAHLDAVYAVLFIDSINVKIREVQSPAARLPCPGRSPWTGSVTCWDCGRHTATGGAGSTLAALGPPVGNQNRCVRKLCNAGLRRPQGPARRRQRVWRIRRASPCMFISCGIRFSPSRGMAQIAKAASRYTPLRPRPRRGTVPRVAPEVEKPTRLIRACGKCVGSSCHSWRKKQKL